MIPKDTPEIRTPWLIRTLVRSSHSSPPLELHVPQAQVLMKHSQPWNIAPFFQANSFLLQNKTTPLFLNGIKYPMWGSVFVGFSLIAWLFKTNTSNQVLFFADFQSHDKATLSPLLFPCGSMRRETLPTVLPQGGVNVHSIMCYDTVEDPNIAANLRSLAEKKVCMIALHYVIDSAW